MKNTLRQHSPVALDGSLVLTFPSLAVRRVACISVFAALLLSRSLMSGAGLHSVPLGADGLTA